MHARGLQHDWFLTEGVQQYWYLEWISSILLKYVCDKTFQQNLCVIIVNISLHNVVVNCGTPDISTNGDVSAMLAYSSTVFNSTVEYTCDIGYDIHGNTSRVCLASGQWSGLAPECFSKQQ